MRVGDVPTFGRPMADMAQAAKVVEEAAEVLAATIAWLDATSDGAMRREELVEECCDAIQATCNLLAGLGVKDVTEEMARVRAKNERRGRRYA